MPSLDILEHHSSKRARLSADVLDDPQANPSGSSSASSVNLNLQRHPYIWFDDGNIVLAASGTGFRIYRGLLTGQSEVFSDMFASSTCSPDETFEGCPVVHLSDSPHDLEHLLRVLLPQSQIHYHTRRTDPVRPFDEIFAVVRLAHKYSIPSVQDQALASLEEYGFITSFNAYSQPQHDHFLLSPSQNIGVVNLARLTDTPSLLPLALYACAYLGSAIFDGWAREGGAVEYLSGADLRRCVDAHGLLAHERAALLSRLFDERTGSGCKNRSACSQVLLRVHRGAVRSENLPHSVDVLADWQDSIGEFGARDALCPSCVAKLCERNKTERKKIFNRLPEIFGVAVEGWGQTP